MALTVRDRDQVERILSRRGERLTRQRAAVLAYLQSTDPHPDARTIYEQVSQSLPQVSLGTTYRTLAVLRDAGLIQELKDGPVGRYDTNIGGHDHAHCVACGPVQDITRRPLPEAAGGDLGGLQVLSHRLEVYGICSACQDGTDQADAAAGTGQAGSAADDVAAPAGPETGAAPRGDKRS